MKNTKPTLKLLAALLLAPLVVLAQVKTPAQSNTVADKTPTAVDELDQALMLACKTLDFVQRSRPCPALASRLKELEQGAAAGEADRAELCQSLRQLRRKIIFTHPLLDFDRLLVNKCPPPAYSHQSRQYLGRYSRPGPGLVVLDNWKDSPRATPLLAGQLPAGTVMHPDLSCDARRASSSGCDSAA